jgi:anti-anti-sigma regulatory factor
MNRRPREVSEEIYHRIYRLSKKKVSIHSIAATLHLPVRTVMGVINRLDRSDTQPDKSVPSGDHPDKEDDSEFLDIYFYPKTRYAIVDLVGSLSDEHTHRLQAELEKTVASSWKAIAVRMYDVNFISEAAGSILLSVKTSFDALGRYFALLDPSASIETDLINYELEGKIPIFGTERAFEETAFSKKGKMFNRRGNQEVT